jgi:hypothetical protein
MGVRIAGALPVLGFCNLIRMDLEADDDRSCSPR